MGAALGAGLGLLLGTVGKGLEAHAMKAYQEKQQGSQLFINFLSQNPYLFADPHIQKAAIAHGLDKDTVAAMGQLGTAGQDFLKAQGLATAPPGAGPRIASGGAALPSGGPPTVGAGPGPGAAPSGAMGPLPATSRGVAAEARSGAPAFTPTVGPEMVDQARQRYEAAQADYLKWATAATDPRSAMVPNFGAQVALKKEVMESAHKDYEDMRTSQQQESEKAFQGNLAVWSKQETLAMTQAIHADSLAMAKMFRDATLNLNAEQKSLAWREKKSAQLQHIDDQITKLVASGNVDKKVIVRQMKPQVDAYMKSLKTEPKLLKVDPGDISDLEVHMDAGTDPSTWLDFFKHGKWSSGTEPTVEEGPAIDTSKSGRKMHKDPSSPSGWSYD